MMANKAIDETAASAQMMANKTINKVIATGLQGSCQGCYAASATGGTQQSKKDNESERRWRMGGVVACRHEVDMIANKRRCCNKRHGEEEEVADTMAMTKEDTAGIGTVVVGWEDEDNENG
jgi:hypothetical protein